MDETLILVVEDDTVIRELSVDILEALGYRVLQAANGNQALATLEEQSHVDLMMTDLGLPDMDGEELAQKARSKHPDLPILLASGHIQNQNINSQEGLHSLQQPLGMIGKPFTLDQLRKKITQMLHSLSINS